MNKKNILVVLLAVVMCFALCSCGGEKAPELTPEEKVLGTWIQEEQGETVVLEADGVGTYAKGSELGPFEIEWSYDDEEKTYEVIIMGLDFVGELNASGDVLTLGLGEEKVELVRQAE